MSLGGFSVKVVVFPSSRVRMCRVSRGDLKVMDLDQTHVRGSPFHAVQEARHSPSYEGVNI